MLVSPSMSPSLGVFVTSPHHLTHNKGLGGPHCRRERHGAKSAPPQVWHRRNQFVNTKKNQVVQQQNPVSSFKIPRNCATAGTKRLLMRHSAGLSSNENDNNMKLSVDDVVWLAEQAREVTSQENRRSVLEEAQKTIRQETNIPDTSRPHSVIGVGLQALTSPMQLSSKHKPKPGQVDHIPVLLSLPSDRTFIPSPDQDHTRHLTTPIDDVIIGQEESRSPSQPLARQCCEIMGPSLCRTCRKLESRLLNREQAEKECPRMRITQENITTTQMVKRFYPRLTDSEIQDKIARGEIARTGFPPSKCRHYRRNSNSSSTDDDSDNSEEHCTSSDETSVKKDKPMKQKVTCQHVSTLMYELAKLKSKLKNQTSTPLYFTDLKRIQSKIISGEVDRRKYLVKEPKEQLRLKSAHSSISTASSTKTTLSKLGVRLSESLLPVFVSPRKVKLCDEPAYKSYYEPPLLSKRRQIPNPSFFAGSSEAYSLPERLPDIIEFADSKIKLLEKQGRSVSSMSMVSNFSEDTDNLASERAGAESGRSGDNGLSMSNSQRDFKMQLAIKEQCEHESGSNHGDSVKVIDQNGVIVNEENVADTNHACVEIISNVIGNKPENNNNENDGDQRQRSENQNLIDNSIESNGHQNNNNSVAHGQTLSENVDSNSSQIKMHVSDRLGFDSNRVGGKEASPSDSDAKVEGNDNSLLQNGRQCGLNDVQTVKNNTPIITEKDVNDNYRVIDANHSNCSVINTNHNHSNFIDANEARNEEDNINNLSDDVNGYDVSGSDDCNYDGNQTRQPCSVSSSVAGLVEHKEIMGGLDNDDDDDEGMTAKSTEHNGFISQGKENDWDKREDQEELESVGNNYFEEEEGGGGEKEDHFEGVAEGNGGIYQRDESDQSNYSDNEDNEEGDDEDDDEEDEIAGRSITRESIYSED